MSKRTRTRSQHTGDLWLRTKAPPDPNRESSAQKLVQFWAPRIMWAQLEEIASRESRARGRRISQATIIRRALKRELHESTLRLQDGGQ